MRALLALLCTLALVGTAVAASFTIPAFTLTGSGNVPFTLPTGDVVHFISPTGSDSNNGLTTSTAWATPNHAMHCGDVIIAATGSYSGGWQDGEWGTVSNCPSTTGGIDGAGGVQFAVLLCAGNVGTCSQNGGANEAFRINVSHWAVSGWKGTQNSNASGGCFSGENDRVEQNYLAFINDIGAGCDLDGFGASGGGNIGGGSFDHVAAVGVVSFNAAQSVNGVCGSGISIGPGNADSDTQTHIYVAGYFGAYNTNIPSGCTVSGSPPHSDGEGIIFDSYGDGYTTNGFNKGVVLRDAVIWHSGNNCLQVFPQGNQTSNDAAQYNFRNVSCYANDQDAQAACGGEVYMHGIYPTGVGRYAMTNSLVLATQNKCGGTGLNIGAAFEVQSPNGTATIDSTKVNFSGNYIWQSAGTTTNVVGNPNTDVYTSGTFGATWIYGTNTYANPGFTNPTALFSTSPNCTAYANVTACMNDTAGLNVYGKIKPTIAPITMGYQPPGACGADGLYPTWLKGIVYLHWNGTALTENSGLVTKPCEL